MISGNLYKIFCIFDVLTLKIKIMSISKPRLTNPANRFYEWKGDKGSLVYYDKEEGKQVKVDLPLKFIVLDSTNTIVGYSEKEQSGIYSNEVHDLTNEVLNVKYFGGGTIAKGKYDQVKDAVKSAGGKFCKVVYAIVDEGGWKLVAFKFSGAAFGSWLEFARKVDLTSKGVQFNEETEDGKKGSVKYKMPTFTSLNLKPEHLEIAIEEDKSLQKYFDSYKAQQREFANEEVVEKEVKFTPAEYKKASQGGDDVGETQEDDDLPF